MKIIKEAIDNVQKPDHYCGEEPMVMAMAKDESDKRNKIIKDIIDKHRKTYGADEKKPFGGDRESGFPKNMKNRDELKKMKLSEKLFTESDAGEYSNKLYDLADNMSFDGLHDMCWSLIKWMTEDDCEEFWRINYSDFDEEDLDESLTEDIEKVGASMRPYLASKAKKGGVEVEKDVDVEKEEKHCENGECDNVKDDDINTSLDEMMVNFSKLPIGDLKPSDIDDDF